MGNYIKGQETKATIVRASAELFYEQSYRRTSFNQISEKSGISISLIHYHFKTKEDILHEVTKELFRKNVNQAEEYTSNADEILIISSYIFWYKFINDAKYKALFCEIFTELDMSQDMLNLYYYEFLFLNLN